MAGEKAYLNDVDNINLLQSSGGALTVSGTNTYTAGTTPALTAYVSGQPFLCTFTNTNTGAATLNIDSQGAVALVRNGSIALKTGDILAGQTFWVVKNASNFSLVGRVTTSWNLTALTLGDAIINTDVTIYPAPAGGNTYTVNDDGTLSFNIVLNRNGIPYDGSTLKVSIKYQLYNAPAAPDEIQFSGDVFFAEDGDDNYNDAGSVSFTPFNWAIGGITEREQQTQELFTFSGAAGSDLLQLTLNRDTLDNPENYTGDFDVYGILIEKA